MLKHRGFPSRLPGTDYQFTIRRDNPKGATKIVARERYKDRNPKDTTADLNFLACLFKQFGEEEVKGDIALERMTEAKDIAPLVTFLASGMADHATGSTIDVNAAS